METINVIRDVILLKRLDFTRKLIFRLIFTTVNWSDFGSRGDLDTFLKIAISAEIVGQTFE